MQSIDFDRVNSPNVKIKEEHGYFTRDGKHIFYASFSPESPPESGIVLCSPFGEEKVRTARILVSFARILAANGVAALCFDYYGDGDSEGDFEDADFDDRLLDIAAAERFLKDREKIARTGLLGLRWGATLAAIASNNLNPDLLILWEPVIDTQQYFFDYLRLNIASQMLADGKVKKNRNDLVKDLENGGSVLIEGYAYTGQFFSKARQHDLRKMDFSHGCRTLLVQIHRNTSVVRPQLQEVANSLKDAEIVAVGREFEWEKTESWMPAPPQLFGKTLEFMEKNGFLGKNI